jgi:transposase
MKPLESYTKEELIALVYQLLARIEELEAEVARLRKNSSNSSKPPSSDIVKPPKRKEKGKRRIGGQPGHHKHEREPFRPEDVDDTRHHTLDRCPDCGGRLRKSRQPDRVVQQVELIERPVEIVEHRSPACWCPSCRRHVYAPLPPAVANGGLIGPHLTALVAYLKGVCHASFSTIRRFFQDVLKVPISRGQLAKLIGKASEALAGGYEALRASLPGEPRLNVDETGHKENGKNLWTWCFRAEMYTLFKIDASRGSEVLVETLGKEFNGVLGCDYFSAYRKYMTDFNVLVQFCLAHLIRDVKFLTTLRDRVTRAYGERVLDGLRRLFKVIHRRETMSKARFEQALERARQALLAVARRAPSRTEAQNLAKRFREHGDAYFRFITTPGVEPTNNLAEQAIRFVVIDRQITQGTRSVKGREWCERIWTVVATCAQQGRSAFAYLRDAVYAYFQRHPAPSLLPVRV